MSIVESVRFPRDLPPKRMSLAGAGIGAVIVLLALVALDPFHQVPAGFIGVKTEFGAVEHVQLDPGLHVVLPFVTAIHDISVQPYTSTTNETAATHDQQNVTTQTAVTWSVDPGHADGIYANFRSGDVLERVIIAPIVANDMKAVISRYDAQELITERSKVAGEIGSLIAGDLARRHVLVTVGGVNITDLQFSQQYDQAIEAKQIAQQQALQARYTLEQAQTSSQQQVVQARAAADANVATAEGNAKATILQADADAQAYHAKEAALSPELLRLTALQKWNGVLPTYMGGTAPIPFLDASGPGH